MWMRAERATRGSIEGTLASQEKKEKTKSIIYLPPMGQNINTEV